MTTTVSAISETLPPSSGPSGDEARRRMMPIDARALRTILTAFAAFVGAGALIGTSITRWASKRGLGSFDVDISEWFAAQRTPTLDTLTDLGSGLSDTLTVVIALAMLAVFFAVTWRRWDEITLLVTALALEVTSFVSIAWIVGRDRPPIEQLDPSPPTSGFPSGHTAAAVALYFGLALIVASQSPGRTGTHRLRTRLAFLVASLAVVAVALSRMYRGMHFLSDVVAGAALGTACLAVAWHVTRQVRDRAGGTVATPAAAPHRFRGHAVRSAPTSPPFGLAHAPQPDPAVTDANTSVGVR